MGAFIEYFLGQGIMNFELYTLFGSNIGGKEREGIGGMGRERKGELKCRTNIFIKDIKEGILGEEKIFILHLDRI